MTADILLPDDEVVAVNWLRGIPALSGIGVSTNLAAEASWGPRTDVFIQVSISPLSFPPHAYFPSHTPRVIVSCWSRPKKWTNAQQIAQTVRAATYVPESVRDVVIPPLKDHGVVVATYPIVKVMAAQVLGEPARVTGESAESLARYDVPILLEWYG